MASLFYELVEGSSFANTDLRLKMVVIGLDTGRQICISDVAPVLRCGRFWKVTTFFVKSSIVENKKAQTLSPGQALNGKRVVRIFRSTIQII